MKKLVSLALLLALVFCVGTALADGPKVGDANTGFYTVDYCTPALTDNGKLGDFDTQGYFYISAPTCTNAGICRHLSTNPSADDENENDVFTHPVPALGHDHKKVSPQVLDYVDTGDGHTHYVYVKYECERCGDIEWRESTVSPRAHEYKWYPESDDLIPCDQPVPVKQKCHLCGYEPDVHDQSEAPGHVDPGADYWYDIVPGTCVTEGSHKYDCTVCGEPQTVNDGIDPDNHRYGKVVPTTPATCTEDGEGHQICWDCSHVETGVPVEATGHNFSYQEIIIGDEAKCDAVGYWTYVCTNDNCDKLGTPATAFGVPASAAFSGYDNAELKTVGHPNAYALLATLPAKDHAWYQIEIPKLPHTYDKNDPVDRKVEPSCLTAGTYTYKCTVCEEEFDTDIAPLGHDWVHTDFHNGNNPAATCLTDGIDTWVCVRANCDGYQSDLTTEENDGATGNVKAGGVGAWMAANTTYGTCEGHALKRETVLALGHDWTEWEEVNGYEEDKTLGYWVRYCQRCLTSQEYFGEGVEFQKVEDESRRVEPTCTEAGETVYILYEVNDTKLENPLGEVTEPIAPLGHDPYDVEAVAPTHTKKGISAGQKCTRCDAQIGFEETDEPYAEGLCDGKDGCETNGKVVYFKDGEVVEDYNGLADFEGGTFYVEDGAVATDANGVTKVDEGEFYWLANGQVAKDYTGLAAYEGTKGFGWFVVEDGKVDLDFNGLYTWHGQQFVISVGKWISDYTGFYWTEDGDILYVVAGMVTNETGLVSYDGAIFYVVDGKLAVDFCGVVEDFNGTEFNVDHGMVR